jgi:putative transposase
VVGLLLVRGPPPLPETGEQVGTDVGLTTFATLSDGQEIATPRFVRREEGALATAPRRLSREEQGTPERIAWRRGDVAHQHSRRIVDQCDLIAVEEVSVNRMTHNHCLAKTKGPGDDGDEKVAGEECGKWYALRQTPRVAT